MVDKYKPGVAPRQHGEGVTIVGRHFVEGWGGVARAAVEWVKEALDGRCPCGVISYWSEGQVLEPIVIPCARASTAAVVCTLRGVVACAGGRVVIVGGGVGVTGVSPTLAGAVLDRAEAVTGQESVAPPRRILFAALTGHGRGDCRLVDALGGHELRWLVRVGNGLKRR